MPDDNSYLFDAESAPEITRLISQDRMITRGMGGTLAEQPDPRRFHDILDLACGPGSWAIDVAFAQPDSEVAGVDASRMLVDYANARARSQQLYNVSFGVMDIRQPLDFTDQSFDLINARLLVAVLQRDMWPGLMNECKRLLKPGGILRLTESDGGLTNSLANEKLQALYLRLMNQAGYGFSPDDHTCHITPALPWLLRKAGFIEIKSKAHALLFSPYDEAYADGIADARISALQARPMLIKTGLVSEEEFDNLYRQMEIELLSNDHNGIWPFLTVWGKKPS